MLTEGISLWKTDQSWKAALGEEESTLCIGAKQARPLTESGGRECEEGSSVSLEDECGLARDYIIRR